MPMPMPIIVASEVDQSGASMKAMTRPVSRLETARPAIATRIGRPAATTEPKVSSRMMRGGGDAEELRADGALLGLLDGLATDGHLHAAGRRGVGEVEQLLRVLRPACPAGSRRRGGACATRVWPSAEMLPGVA